MHASTDRLEFAPPPTPGLPRALVLAVLAHSLLLAALTWGVHWKSQTDSITAEAELWSAVPQAAAPKLIEAPPEPPAPPPIPPAPVPPALADADIAIAQEKLRLQREKQAQLERLRELERQRLAKLKQEQLLLEKKRLQQERELAQKAADEKQKAKQEAERKEALKAQQEAKKLAAMRQENLQRMSGLAGATGAPGATGSARQSSGPSAGYAGRIRARIKPNLVFTDDISSNPTAEAEVRTAPDGTIISRKLIQSSGVASWDDAVIKAIDKTATLPRDVDGRVPPVLVISFRPKD